MLHHHSLKRACFLLLAVGWVMPFAHGCSAENLSELDSALKQVLVKDLEMRMPPRLHKDLIPCVAFLDTPRNPPPSKPPTEDFDRLCRQALKEGRVKDPEPWLIPSIRREFFFDPPHMRPLSECLSGRHLTADQFERAYLIVVERMVRVRPDTIVITLQERAVCGQDGRPEGSWGSRVSCTVKLLDGRWSYSGCGIDLIT